MTPITCPCGAVWDLPLDLDEWSRLEAVARWDDTHGLHVRDRELSRLEWPIAIQQRCAENRRGILRNEVEVARVRAVLARRRAA